MTYLLDPTDINLSTSGFHFIICIFMQHHHCMGKCIDVPWVIIYNLLFICELFPLRKLLIEILNSIAFILYTNFLLFTLSILWASLVGGGEIVFSASNIKTLIAQSGKMILFIF